ncbi:MAG: hypothetical protein JWM10_4710, partial [Myxococcaceae bacterium]|nr:hypothetical protein [Myxococcaceae bacterium]
MMRTGGGLLVTALMALTVACESDPVPSPGSDAGAVDAPASDAPAADLGGFDAPPAIDASAIDAPSVDSAVDDTASVDVAADVPSADAPSTDVPPADAPPTDVPPADAPSTDVPPADVPPADVPSTDVPPVDVPSTDVPPVDAGAACPAVTRLLEGRTVSPSGVAMFFAAEDCLGRPLTDLAATDFVVREDGIALGSEASATLITRVGPQVFVSLVLDLSASTNAFLPQLTAAAAQFITTLQTVRHLPVQIGLQVFAGEAGLTEWQAPTVDTARLLARLDALATYHPADPGSTNLYGATIAALGRQATAEAAFRARNAGGAFTTGYVVLFTDGGDTAGLRTQADAVAAVRGSADRTLAVGLAGGDSMPAVLSALAPGGVLTAPDASTLAREFDALASRIAAEFRALYLLGYCSARRAGEHTVTVSVAGGTTAPAASYGFSAAGFGPGCTAATFTAACAAADQCGGLGCGACDDRTTLCDGASRRCIDDCVTANRCGGETFTNPLGYAQVCADRPGATACGGACRDTRTDAAHCGRCGNACAAGTLCVAGLCEVRAPRSIAP